MYGKPVHVQGGFTMIHTTYTNARANFAALCDEASENREIVVIRRRKGGNVALIAAEELESLVESAHTCSVLRRMLNGCLPLLIGP
jgi:PHD/YefM family antitoxin component YafN of YafNO toxin-antitoxin module